LNKRPLKRQKSKRQKRPKSLVATG